MSDWACFRSSSSDCRVCSSSCVSHRVAAHRSEPCTEPIWLGCSLQKRPDRLPLWICLLSISSPAGIISGTIAHFVTIAGDHGIAPADATMMLTYMAGALVLGQIFIGLALDRVRSPVLIRPVYLGILAGVLLINFSFDEFGIRARISDVGLFRRQWIWPRCQITFTRILRDEAFWRDIRHSLRHRDGLANGIRSGHDEPYVLMRTGSYSGCAARLRSGRHWSVLC